MLSKRFENDGKAQLSLNEVQVSVRDVINQKITDDSYQFESVPCGICGSNQSEKLSQKDRYGLRLPVVICKECGLIYTNPRMNQSSYAQFYDCEYRQLYHGAEYPIDELYKKTLTRGKRISSFLKNASLEILGKRVLEVGCGAGGILSHFRDEFNCEIKGCDFGSQGVEYGVKQHGLDLEVGDLKSISLSWKADIIIYSHVLEHILDLKSEFERVNEILADDGILYIEVPSVKGIRQNYDFDFLRYLQNAHTYHFTLTTLSNLMHQHGFELITGNEFTQAAFKKTENVSTSLVNDYEATVRFLKSTEFHRRFFGKYYCKMKKFGLRLYHKIFPSL